MIKLNKYVDALENVIEKIEQKVEELEEKKNSIEEKASEENRDMTKAEWNKFFKLEEQIEDLQCEIDEIENAIDYLRGYCD